MPAEKIVHVLTQDESLLASARAAVRALEGWDIASVAGAEALQQSPPPAGHVIMLDGRSRPNAYELCRRLTRASRCRTFIVVGEENDVAEPIARFAGATGVLHVPMTATDLRKVLETEGLRGPLPAEARGTERSPVLPQELLRDLEGAADADLIEALVDPETQLFNYAFLNYKLDEEYKRADRFGQPLACVMLGYETEVSQQVLSELAGIILTSSRDTDILGRFDATSFLFLLPNTGPDGAKVMASRVEEQVAEMGLRDLVGDPLQIAVGISTHPHPDVRRREDLYARARAAFLEAQQVGGGVVTAV